VSTQGAALPTKPWVQTWPSATGITAQRLHRVALVLTAAAISTLSFLQPTGPGNTSPTDVAIGAAIGAVALWAYFSRSLIRAPYGISVGLLIIAGCISGIVGPALRALTGPVDVSYPANALLAVIQDLFLLCWCLALVNLARSAATLRVILAAWIYGAAVAAALLVVGVVFGITALSGISADNGVRAQGRFGDPNMAANYFALSIFVLWSSANPRRTWLRACLLALFMAAMVFTGSNGAFLNLGIGITFVLVVEIRRRFGLMAVVIAACLALVIGAGTTQLVNVADIQRSARDSGIPILHDWIGRSDSSASQRGVILQEAWTLFQQSGPLGAGPNSTKSLLQDSLAPYPHQAHDDYVAAVVERGVLGGIALIVLICTIAFRASQALGGRLRPDFAAVVPRREPLIGALLGLAAAAAYYEVLHFRHLWALLAVIAILQLWGRDWAKT
jgi:O-antigen ligase